MTDIYTLAPQIIQAIEALEVPGQVTDEQASYIASLFPAGRVGMDVFIELDERPGYWDPAYASGDWHWKLRQTRNGYSYLFDRFNEDVAAQRKTELAETTIEWEVTITETWRVHATNGDEAIELAEAASSGANQDAATLVDQDRQAWPLLD